MKNKNQSEHRAAEGVGCVRVLEINVLTSHVKIYKQPEKKSEIRYLGKKANYLSIWNPQKKHDRRQPHYSHDHSRR